MGLHGRQDGFQQFMDCALSVSAELEGSEDIARARALTRSFLADLRAVHGLEVSVHAMWAIQLVVSELVTNARKYAPGPCLLTLKAGEGAVEVTVWDSELCLPVARSTDPCRVGQHGLEIVTAVCRSFEMRREPVGKRITASVALADGSAGDEAGD